MIIKKKAAEANVFHNVLCLEQRERNEYNYDKLFVHLASLLRALKKNENRNTLEDFFSDFKKEDDFVIYVTPLLYESEKSVVVFDKNDIKNMESRNCKHE